MQDHFLDVPTISLGKWSVVFFSYITGNKELLRAKVLLWKSNLDTQTFWGRSKYFSSRWEITWKFCYSNFAEFWSNFLLSLFFKDPEVPKLRLGMIKTSKHGNETSNFKDLMVVRFLCNSTQEWQHRNQKKLSSPYLDEEVQVKFLTTLLFKLILVSLTRLSRILHGFYSFEDDDKNVFTDLWIQPVIITFPISNTGGGKPKGNSSAAETSRVQGM